MHPDMPSAAPTSACRPPSVRLRDVVQPASWLAVAAPVAVVVALYGACHWALQNAGPLAGHWAAQGLLVLAVSLLPLLAVAPSHARSCRWEQCAEAFALCRPADPERVVSRVVLWSVVALLVVGLIMSIRLAGMANDPAPEGVERALASLLPQGWWLSVMLVVIVAPVCEELMFRGWLHGRLERVHRSPVTPVLVTSIVFAALHLPQTPLHGATLVGIAVVLGYLRARSGSVWPGLVLHAAWNATFLALMATAIVTGAL